MSLRILVVDDHAAVRQGLKGLLCHQGWEVVDEAEDGAEAVEKAELLRPDVVVLDLSMPRMNGLEACRKIHKNLPDSEILIVTQHDSPQMMHEASNAHASGYVVKSDLSRDLVRAVDAVSQHKVFWPRGA